VLSWWEPRSGEEEGEGCLVTRLMGFGWAPIMWVVRRSRNCRNRERIVTRRSCRPHKGAGYGD
jgi:hypothetical protein